MNILLGCVFLMFTATIAHASSNLSHEPKSASLQAAIDQTKSTIQSRKDLSSAEIAEQLMWVDLLSSFKLGQFLLERGGLNGYWTDYIVHHPQKRTVTNNPVESFLLNQAPTVLATQERFTIFISQIQKRLRPGAHLASIPCGVMSELFDLDFSHTPKVTLTGIDLDKESLQLAKERSGTVPFCPACQFVQEDAWQLSMQDTFDLISSNGLTIYESDDNKVIELYKIFFSALKPNGYLVTSFLTPPPIPGRKTEWKLEAVNPADAARQKVLFTDILHSKWQIFRSEEVVLSQLKAAGFQEIEILYDKAHIFPTVLAKKL